MTASKEQNVGNEPALEENFRVEDILSEFGSESRMERAADPLAPSGMVVLDEGAVTELLESVQALRQEVAQLRAEVQGGAAAVADEEAPLKSEKAVKQEKKEKNKALSIVGNVLFYAMLAALVVGAFLMKSSMGGRPFTFAGYSAFTVLSSSMEEVYPKGSLVVTKSVDANTLEVGDDITFMISESASVTHRIIGITENYQNTGQRAFETKGVMNEAADKELVSAVNVVGQVVFCSKALGDAAVLIKKNWPILLFFAAVMMGLWLFLRWNFRRTLPEEKKKPPAEDTGGKKSPARLRKTE